MVKWIPIERIQALLHGESFVLAIFFMVVAYLFYFFVLKRIAERRHASLRRRFLITSFFIIISATFASLHWLMFWKNMDNLFVLKFSNYMGLISMATGAIAVIRIAQIYVYLYLFFSNITTGVPRLIGNLFTCIFSIFIFGLIASNIFDFNIATIATTSAIFSLVLGLALQDTLGNFFSGLALQIDRPFQINDWVEIHNGEEKWVGQIYEINWRATFLTSFADEMVMIPNKTVAQSHIIILNHPHKPIRLNQMFRFGFETPIETAKIALLEAIQGFPEVMKNPAPTTLITETTDSWITLKVFYSLHDYGTRYRTGDAVITKTLESIRKHGLTLAHQSVTLKPKD